MKPQSVCALVVRLMGLALVVWLLPSVVGGFGEFLRQLSINKLSYVFGSYTKSRGYFLAELGVFLQLALGLYMLFGGKRLVRLLLRGLPGVPGLCSRCGYDISGLDSLRCPECGAKIPERPSPGP